MHAYQVQQFTDKNNISVEQVRLNIVIQKQATLKIMYTLQIDEFI